MRIERFYRDLVIVAVALAAALYLAHSGHITDALSHFGEQVALGSFLTGIFFTSVFTLGPASVILAELAEMGSPLTVAFFGGLGAMFGDAILFLFVRDIFADDLREFLARHRFKLFTLPHLGFMRWLYPAMGALIIASPLPDELGLALLGLTKTKLAVLLPIAFVMNFLGILLVAEIAARL